MSTVKRNPDASRGDRYTSVDYYERDDKVQSIFDESHNETGYGTYSDYSDPVGPEKENYYVTGAGGKVRHSGKFSPDNPYYEQLRVATGNQDQDALYELAVKWEGDNATYETQLANNRSILEEQREYDRQVLEEQRAYDSPEAQIARQRMAGINPDIAGATGGASISSGSSAQMANNTMMGATQAQTTGSTSFKNQYQDTSLALEGIQTAASLMSAVTGMGGGVVSAIDTLATLPSRINSGNASANLQNAQANAVNELLPAQKTGQTLDNIGKTFNNVSQGTQNAFKLSSMFTKDDSDETIASVLGAFGVPAETIKPQVDSIRAFQQNPGVQALHSRDRLNARKAEAEDRAYTDQVLDDLFKGQIKERFAEQAYNIADQSLKASINNLLISSGYVEQQAEVISGNAVLQSEEVQFQLQDLRENVRVYTNLLADREKSVTALDDEISAINKRATDGDRELTSREKARIKMIEQEKARIRSANTQALYNMYDTVIKSQVHSAFEDQNMNRKGNFRRGTAHRNRQNQALLGVCGRYLDGQLSDERLGDEIFRYITSGIDTLTDVATAVAEFK